MSELRRGQHLHFDPLSGIAGDMAVAALVDLGVPEKVVRGAVAAMGVDGLKVSFEARRRGAYMGKGFVVHAPSLGAGHHEYPTEHEHEHEHEHAHEHEHEQWHAGDHPNERGHGHHRARSSGNPSPRGTGDVGPAAPARPVASHHHRDYAEIRRLLRRASLDADAKALAEDIFARIAEVEAALHGAPLDKVAFHEVGAFDSIADVVGAAAAIAWLAPSSISSSAPVVGTGRVRTAHGPVPVPAPATAALLRGIPILPEGVGELTTPTGAALLACVVDVFGPAPPLTLSSIGYGAGTRELSDRANVLRVMLGQPFGPSSLTAASSALLLQANIDDMNPQLLPVLLESLFAAGALDGWSSPIVMKKGRPAFEVSALVEAERMDSVQRAFFFNSTTLGVRRVPVARTTLARSTAKVETPWGAVRVKVAAWDGQPVNAQPEFDDCRRLAAGAGVPVKRVWTAAMAAAEALTSAAKTPLRLTPRLKSKRSSKRSSQPSSKRSSQPSSKGSGVAEAKPRSRAKKR